jgi:hypothetical protein
MNNNHGQQWMAGIQESIESSRTGRPKGMPSLPQIKAETAKLGLPDSDAEALFDVWLSNGFTLKGGRKIKDWKACIRNWHRNGWFDSQRRSAKRPAAKDVEAEELAKIRRAMGDG